MTGIINTGTPRSKRKGYASAAAAQAARDDAAWRAQYATLEAKPKRIRKPATAPPSPAARALAANADRLPVRGASVDTPDPPRDGRFRPKIGYTGTGVKGVVLQHKSTYVPVMHDNPDAIIEATHMRR